MSKRFDQIKSILEELRTETPGVKGVVLANMEGISMAATNMDLEEHVAAGAAISLSTGEKFLKKLKKKGLKQLLIQEEDNSYVLIVRSGDQSFLAVVTTPEAKLGMVFLDAKRAAEEIEKLV